jgi:hypothetical protein
MFFTGLTMLADASPLVTYLVAAATAASLVVTRPTQSALLPSLAMAPADCTVANGASGFFEGGGQLIGPLAAAAILAVGTPATVFFAGSATLGVALLVTVGVRPRMAPIVFATDDDGVGLLGGLRLVLADRDARVLVGLLTARMLVIGACDVLFVLLALELLDTGEPGAGILAAALGAGAMLGGAGTFTIVGRPRLAAVAAAGALVWGAAIATVGIVPSAFAAPALVVIGGAGLAIVDICGRTMIQRSVRDEILARVFGLQEGLGMAGLATGAVLVPILVEAFGLVGAVIAVAASCPSSSCSVGGAGGPRARCGRPCARDRAPARRSDLPAPARTGVGGGRSSSGLARCTRRRRTHPEGDPAIASTSWRQDPCGWNAAASTSGTSPCRGRASARSPSSVTFPGRHRSSPGTDDAPRDRSGAVPRRRDGPPGRTSQRPMPWSRRVTARHPPRLPDKGSAT